LGVPFLFSLLGKDKPDVAILATGPRPSFPPIPGISEAGAVTSEAREVKEALCDAEEVALKI